MKKKFIQAYEEGSGAPVGSPLVSASGIILRKFAHVYQTVAQSIPTTTWVQMMFNAQTATGDGLFTTSSSGIVVNADGWYDIHGGGAVGAGGQAFIRQCRIILIRASGGAGKLAVYQTVNETFYCHTLYRRMYLYAGDSLTLELAHYDSTRTTDVAEEYRPNIMVTHIDGM